ncbi:Putative uncharacterized protein [Lactococcus lactis subsp. lactis A12]|uniref:Uncharacterized protein n=1 Tax=Lactococcus lactis subsp. lactis A12 TaxID=1137134 RepID=S6EUG5_LACLL|nr:Putative uncharacterized protein [Lactococcus lactis subsp. lactis A12]SBW30725.1 Hypothetical protein LLA12_01575 [Lactococcus lactis subsp. lactis]
MNSTNETSLN